MLLGRYTQQPGERIKRIIDLSSWLESAETVLSVTVEITPVTNTAFTCTSVIIDPGGKKFAYFLAGGEDGETYEVKFSITTQTQLRQDEVEIDVEEI